MREVSSVFIVLCLFCFKFNSAKRLQPTNTQTRTTATTRGSTFELLQFWEPHESSSLEESVLKRKREEGYHHSEPVTHANRIYFTKKYRRGRTARFRSQYEENEGNWPKLKPLVQSKNRRENLRSTRLIPLQQKQSYGSKRNTDSDEPILPKPNFNPFSFKYSMEEILKDIPGTNITIEVIGTTVEYNDIVLCKISPSKYRKSKYFRANEDRYVEEEPERKILLIVHGLSTMGFHKVPYLSNERYFKKLVEIYAQHLDKFDIYLVPMANPDAVGDDTLLDFWNKNKSPQSACLGVALDRNFDVAWNESRRTSCDQLYPGPEAFSEVESRAIGDLMHIYSHKIVAYIHVHAGTYSASVFKGDAVLYPKGYSSSTTDDDKYIDMKGEIEDAMKTAGFRVMSVTMDTLYNWYGRVLGTSVDYASTVYGIPYALEFVMQVYENNPTAQDSDELISSNVLTEIWERVIGVVFEHIHKNTISNDVK